MFSTGVAAPDQGAVGCPHQLFYRQAKKPRVQAQPIPLHSSCDGGGDGMGCAWTLGTQKLATGLNLATKWSGSYYWIQGVNIKYVILVELARFKAGVRKLINSGSLNM